MKLHPDGLFHIYNRGNNGQTIFFTNQNYLFFLKKIRKYTAHYADFLAWCLMLNHFHFLIHTPAHIDTAEFSDGLRLTLMSYTKAVNSQEGRTGSLFEQNTVSKILDTNEYSLTCFHFIHQNPFRAGWVQKLEEWEYSSFRDYAGLRQGTLVNKPLAYSLLDLPTQAEVFYKESYQQLDAERLRGIW